METNNTSLPVKIVQQAIAWRICLESGNAQKKDLEAYQRWRIADPMHEIAWQRIEHVESAFNNTPNITAAIAHSTLKQTDLDIQNLSRRQAIKKIAGTAFSLTAIGWIIDKQGTWQYINADYATTNQRQHFILADNSQIWLNSDSAIELNFSDKKRKIDLTRGEIQFTDAASLQPLQVSVPQGLLNSQSQHFFVRHGDDHALLKVMHGSVSVQPNNSSKNTEVHAGELYKITANSVHQLDNHIFDYSSWTEGIFSVRNMPIKHFLSELSRYHRGFLNCAPSLENYLVSGVFQLNDTDLILTTLARTARAKVHYITRWWAEIRP